MTFDFKRFSEGKFFKVTGLSKWLDYNTKQCLGTKVETVISKDETPYKQNDGETVTNLYEKVTFKIPKDVKVPLNSYVMPINAVGVVYGEYRNLLSVTADNIQILQPKINSKTA